MKIINFPGASLLELSPVTDGLRVRCPGCDVVMVVRDRTDMFIHKTGCPVHTRITKATQRYAAKVNYG
jgi:hypothetical protein